MGRWLVPAALVGLVFIAGCAGEEAEVPLADSLEALFPLAEELLAAADKIEAEGFETTAWLVQVEDVPATHELARQAKAALRDAVTAFGSYAVGKLPNDYVTGMDYYHHFEEVMDRILVEVMSEDEAK
ncbi:MAG TPA: hypothetical protein VM054_01050 [bacterium]|nr:hypothetical protein [bacterium]